MDHYLDHTTIDTIDNTKDHIQNLILEYNVFMAKVKDIRNDIEIEALIKEAKDEGLIFLSKDERPEAIIMDHRYYDGLIRDLIATKEDLNIVEAETGLYHTKKVYDALGVLDEMEKKYGI